jgi:hypothetical protein
MIVLAFLIHTALPTVGTVALGVVGWIVTHFAAVPILDFYGIRRRIHEELFFTKNVAPGFMPDEDVRKAIASIRRQAARLDALRVSLRAVPRAYLSWCRYNLVAASGGLIGISNSFGTSDGSLALHRHALQKSLKLPVEYTDEQISAIDEARRRTQG